MEINSEENIENIENVTYIDFKDIENFEESTEIEKVIKKSNNCIVNDKSNWIDRFNSYNNLRVVIKFYGNQIKSIKNEDFYMKVNKDLLSIRSTISKISILFIKDMLIHSTFDNEYKFNLFRIFFNSLVMVSFNKNKKFLSSEALFVLNEFIRLNSSLKVFIFLLNNVETRFSNVLLTLLDNYISFFHEKGESHEGEFSFTDENEAFGLLSIVISGIIRIYLMKKEPFFKKSKGYYSFIMNYIHGHFNEQSFDKYYSSNENYGLYKMMKENKK